MIKFSNQTVIDYSYDESAEMEEWLVKHFGSEGVHWVTYVKPRSAFAYVIEFAQPAHQMLFELRFSDSAKCYASVADYKVGYAKDLEAAKNEFSNAVTRIQDYRIQDYRKPYSGDKS